MKDLKLRVTTAGFLCLLVLIGTVAWAASTYLPNALINGRLVQRWNDTNHTIAVTIQAGRGIPGWSSDLIPLVKSAFSEWESAMGGRLRFEYTNDPSKTDILVTWSRRAYGTQVGHQTVRYEGNILTNADITIAMLAPNGQALSKSELRTVALHEVGHALGIRGHSQSADDVMYPSLQPSVVRLSPSDIATMKALYQRKADVTNPKGVHLMAFRQYRYYVNLGIEALGRKDAALALDYLQKAKGYYPNDPNLPYYLGVVSLNMKRYGDAVTYLDKAALISNENQGESMFLLATALSLHGAEAIQKQNKLQGKASLERAKQVYAGVLQSPKTTGMHKKQAKAQLERLKALNL